MSETQLADTPLPNTRYWAVKGVMEHTLRESLANEIHARPPPSLTAPCRISFLALTSGERGGQRDRDHVVDLCRRFGVAEPPPAAIFWHVDVGPFRLNWERHNEFSAYWFIRQGAIVHPFRDCVIERVPADWLADLAGELLVATHLELEHQDAPERGNDDLNELFASDNLAASIVAGGSARVWTDFRLQGDGFSRILVRDQNLTPRQAGRLAQRLFEIETYRMMALLGFPLARQVSAQVSDAEAGLAQLTERLSSSEGTSSDPELLDQVTALAAEVERLSAAVNYRFNATRAYHALVQRRFQHLREQRFEGRSTLQEFMDRRLSPAMRTCDSVAERLAILSERVGRAANLLRTRVDVAVSQQNRDLLASMDRRAQIQLRLQETVEGLSVVVLSYYLSSLLGYGFKSLEQAGVPINATLATGLAVPVVVLTIWFGMRRLRSKMLADD